jgi:hypothetical protein
MENAITSQHELTSKIMRFMEIEYLSTAHHFTEELRNHTSAF